MEAVKKEKPNNKDNKNKKKGIIIGTSVLGVAAVGAVTAVLLVKSCEDNDGVNYTISHANLSKANVSDLAFEYADGSTIQITSYDPTTKEIHGTVTDANATGGKVTSANVSDAGFEGDDHKDGLIDAANPAVIHHALFSGKFDGVFSGDANSITGDATTGFAVNGTKWSVSKASATDANFKNFFATSGKIIDNAVSTNNQGQNGNNNGTGQTNNGSTPPTIPLNPAQQAQAAQNNIQQQVNQSLNTSTPSGQAPQNPVYVVTNAINNAGYKLVPNTTPTQQPVNSKPITSTTPYVAQVTPQASTTTPVTPNTPAPTPITVSVVVPPVVDHTADFNDNTKTNSTTNKQLDENNWNKLTATDFTLSADAPQGTTITSVKTNVSSVPTNDTDIEYTVTLSYNGTTKDVAVKVPFKAPSQDTLDQRALDVVTINSLATLYDTLPQTPTTNDIVWTTKLEAKYLDAKNLPTGLTLEANTSENQPTNDKVVNFTVKLKLNNATKTIVVPVNYKAPKQDKINDAAAQAASVNLSVPATLNESNWNALKPNDFKVISPRTDISITTTPQSAVPTQDGDVTYDVVVTVGTGADAKSSTKQVKVPFKALLNGLTASTTREVNDSNWDALTSSDFTLSQTGLTITGVKHQSTIPSTTGQIDYTVEVSLGNKTQSVTTKVNFTKLDGKISTTKTVDEQTWDKLTQADFDLAIDSKFANAYVSKVEAPTTKPTVDSNITYKVTYTYGTFSEDKDVTVSFAFSDAYHAGNANVTPQTGFTLGYSNWDKLTAANLNVPANASVTDIIATSNKPDPKDKTITSITYKVKIKVGSVETTKTISVPYGAPNIQTVEYWTYGGTRYDDHNKALAAAKTGEEAKITSVKKFFYKNVQYDDQASAEAEQAKDIAKEIIETTYDGSISKPANGQPAPTQTSNTVYVYNNKVYDTLANAQAAWTNDNPDIAEKTGSFEVKYDGKTIKTITIDSSNKSVYTTNSAAKTDASGKLTWVYVSTGGAAAHAEVLPNAATLPAVSKTTIKIGDDSYTYHTVGDVTAASNTTTGKKYDITSITNAIQGAVLTTADDSKSVNIDGTVYKFENVVEKHPQAYTLDELKQEVGTHKVTIDGTDYYNATKANESVKLKMLTKDATGVINDPNIGDVFADQIHSMGDTTVKATVYDETTSSAEVTNAISFVTNETIQKLDTWLTKALTKLNANNDLKDLDSWNGAGEDNWLWFWNTFAKSLVKSFVDQTQASINVDNIFDGDHSIKTSTVGKGLSGDPFFDNIHNMAKLLGMSDDDANAYTAAGSGADDAYKEQKITGMLFATSKPSTMFSNPTNTTTSKLIQSNVGADYIRYTRLSDIDAMKALLSYWSAYAQRMLAIGKGAVFSTNQILLQPSPVLATRWSVTLGKFPLAFSANGSNASGIASLQNTVNLDHSGYGSTFMFSLGNVDDWKNSQFYKSRNQNNQNTLSYFKVVDGEPIGMRPCFIMDNSLSETLSGSVTSIVDQKWLDFANENLSAEIRNLKGIKINIGGVDYLVTSYYQRLIENQFVGLYNQQPTWVLDAHSNSRVTPTDMSKYTDKNKIIDVNNGLLLPTNNAPKGPFYKLSDKYNWTQNAKSPEAGYVPASKGWNTAIPTGDYYKVIDTTKISNGYDYTTTLQDGVEDYQNTNVNALPATEGWYKDNDTTTTPVVLNGTYYVKKGKQDSDHEYVTDKTDGVGYSPAVTNSQVDTYKLQYDGQDVLGVTQDVTWTSATKPVAPTIETSKVTVDSFVAYTAPVSHNVATESVNAIASQAITSDAKAVSDAVTAGTPLDKSAVTISSGNTWKGWVYGGNVYDTKANAEIEFNKVQANAVSSQDLKLEYNGTTYGTEDLAKQASEANSIKIVDASKQTEDQVNGVKFNPSLKVDVILATQDPKDIYN